MRPRERVCVCVCNEMERRAREDGACTLLDYPRPARLSMAHTAPRMCESLHCWRERATLDGLHSAPLARWGRAPSGSGPSEENSPDVQGSRAMRASRARAREPWRCAARASLPHAPPTRAATGGGCLCKRRTEREKCGWERGTCRRTLRLRESRAPDDKVASGAGCLTRMPTPKNGRFPSAHQPSARLP